MYAEYVSAVGSKKHFKILKEQDWYFFWVLKAQVYSEVATITKYFLKYGVLSFMVIHVVEFSSGGYKIRNIFA